MCQQHFINGKCYDTEKADEAIEMVVDILITMMIYNVHMKLGVQERDKVVKYITEYLSKNVMQTVNRRDDYYQELGKEYQKNFMD